MFRAVGDCLKYALEQQYLTEKDLYSTDKEVMKKIEKHLRKDKKLNLLYMRMNKKVKAENNPEDFNAHVFCKSRMVDPLCSYKGSIKRVSDIEPRWKNVITKESKPKEYFIKFSRL